MYIDDEDSETVKHALDLAAATAFKSKPNPYSRLLKKLSDEKQPGLKPYATTYQYDGFTISAIWSEKLGDDKPEISGWTVTDDNFGTQLTIEGHWTDALVGVGLEGDEGDGDEIEALTHATAEAAIECLERSRMER